MSNKAIRVLIVDDSFFMCKLIKEIIEEEPMIEIVGQAKNGIEAVEMAIELRPDVITMDYNMPMMDGEKATYEILKRAKVPPAIIMLSASTKEGAAITLKCLRAGAVDFIAKPSGEISMDLDVVRNEIISKIKNSTQAKIKRYAEIEKKTKDKNVQKVAAAKAIVIGASTGGPPIVEEIISELPSDLSVAVFIVQHMPEHFTKSFAERLDGISRVHVKEAEDGDIVSSGVCYIAPGGWHMVAQRVNPDKPEITIHLNQDEKENGFRPSVDVTMMSVATLYRDLTMGVILSGMGYDGTEGMSMIKELGGYTVVQSRETSVIYSMPGSVVTAGLADDILDPKDIAKKIIELSKNI